MPSIINQENLEKMLATPLSSDQDELIKLRDKALLEILAASKLKVSKLSGMKIKEIDAGLPKRAKTWLDKYLSARQDVNPYLFINFDRARKTVDEPLTKRSIQRLVEKYSRMSGIEKVTPESFRKINKSLD